VKLVYFPGCAIAIVSTDLLHVLSDRDQSFVRLLKSPLAGSRGS